MIRTGLFAKPILSGDIVYLQVRHFDEMGNLTSNLNADLKADGIANKHLLKSGDVLFAAKGWKNFATIYRSDFPAVASTAFFVLRTDEKVLLPEFLAWRLNSPSTKSRLKRKAIGSAIVSISKSVLSDLELKLPTLEKQKLILEISRLSTAEQALRTKIAALRQIQVQQAIKKAIR